MNPNDPAAAQALKPADHERGDGEHSATTPVPAADLLRLCDEIEASAIWEYWHPQLRPILAAARQSVRMRELLKKLYIPPALREIVAKELGND